MVAARGRRRFLVFRVVSSYASHHIVWFACRVCLSWILFYYYCYIAVSFRSRVMGLVTCDFLREDDEIGVSSCEGGEMTSGG